MTILYYPDRPILFTLLGLQRFHNLSAQDLLAKILTGQDSFSPK
jgi:hypothetical protein